VGVVLIADGFDNHVPKGYIYFAMAFSVAVEALNIRMRGRRAAPVHLRDAYARAGPPPDPDGPGDPRPRSVSDRFP
jgi:hypothetical protein